MNKKKVLCVLLSLFASGLVWSGAAATAPSVQQSIGKRITVQGTAVNSKAGAAVRTTAQEIIFIDGLASWGRDAGKSLEVSGLLQRRKFIPDPQPTPNAPIRQGAEGLQYVFAAARWKFLDDGMIR